GVAGPAGGRLRGGVRGGRSVTRGACLVSRVRSHEGRLPHMTRDTQSLCIDRRKGVRLMTGFAGDASRMSTGVDSGDLRMTARAGRRDETRIVGVGLVARDARALFPVGNMDIGMTPDAGRGRVSRCVWQVTARAHGMRWRRLRGERG